MKKHYLTAIICFSTFTLLAQKELPADITNLAATNNPNVPNNIPHSSNASSLENTETILLAIT